MPDQSPPAGPEGAPTRLARRLDEPHAPAWNPEPGDKLIGRLVQLDHFPGQYGTYPILTLEVGEGRRVAVHAFTEVLLGQLQRSSPRVGELLGIKYEGKVERDTAPAYHSYRVAVDRPGEIFNWGEPTPADGPVEDFRPGPAGSATSHRGPGHPNSAPPGVPPLEVEDIPF